MEFFNIARQKAFTSFYNTLDKLYGRKDITEKEFKSKWQENLEKETNILADGWYNPPPNGMAVLFGDRVSFDTLRDNKNWASEKTINWKEDLIYVYCSPIDKKSGIIGDMSLTLYFGENIEIKKHIKNCYKAVQEVFCELDKVQNSQELFVFSEKIFEKYQLKNCIISKTDNTPLDLGHTFPKLINIENRNKLTQEEKQDISKARKFINYNNSWNFIEGIQFTIEPQLISIENSKLPQISQHFLIKKTKDKFIVSNDVEQALIKYNNI